MRVERLGRWIVFTALFLWAALCRAQEAPQNVVLILADDLGIGDVSCYAAHDIETPNIDRLAGSGLRFNQAYTTGSVCSPTRYSLLTGRYPSRGPMKSGAVRAGSPLVVDVELPTLARTLKDLGFRTAAFGKWHLGYGPAGADGSGDWSGELSPGPLELGFEQHFGIPSNHNDRRGYVVQDRMYVTKRIHDLVDGMLTDAGCRFIRERAADDQRFFLYLPVCAIHTHITPAEQFRGLSTFGQLGDYILELDHNVGRVLDTLDEVGLAEDTLVIFTSDNGGQQYDTSNAGTRVFLASEAGDARVRARTAKRDAWNAGHRTNGPLRGFKGGIHEGGFRVPMIFSWPRGVAADRETEQLVSMADLFATIVRLVEPRASGPFGEDSVDLSPVIRGAAAQVLAREGLLLQAADGRLAYRHGDWKLIMSVPPSWEDGRPIFPDETYELYNVAVDPHERNNLAEEHPYHVADLKQRLLLLFE
ncbi:MAG: arylsulfatase [Planctomycetota bacterium]